MSQGSSSLEPNANTLRRAIGLQIESFDRAFLVLDDLDLAWGDFQDYEHLEDELETLNALGLKIFATSRVQFRSGIRFGNCDVKYNHRSLNFWWQCSICEVEDPDYYICNKCRDEGHRCPKL